MGSRAPDRPGWVEPGVRDRVPGPQSSRTAALLFSGKRDGSRRSRPGGEDVPPRPADQGPPTSSPCLLYTSDAADDLLCVALGGRRIIKKKKKKKKKTKKQA